MIRGVTVGHPAGLKLVGAAMSYMSPEWCSRLAFTAAHGNFSDSQISFVG
jgi:hypothetical protein